jgi:hypothetical protein
MHKQVIEERERPIMDNFQIDIRSCTKTHFDEALRIAFDAASGQKATHYKITKNHGFILYWNGDNTKGLTAFPYEMSCNDATPFVWGWLQKVEYEDYEEPCDEGGDVHNVKAFRIFNEGWGHVDHDHFAFIAVKPAWAWLGK